MLVLNIFVKQGGFNHFGSARSSQADEDLDEAEDACPEGYALVVLSV